MRVVSLSGWINMFLEVTSFSFDNLSLKNEKKIFFASNVGKEREILDFF